MPASSACRSSSNSSWRCWRSHTNSFARLIRLMTSCSSRDGSTGGCHTSGRTTPTTHTPGRTPLVPLEPGTYPIRIPVRLSSRSLPLFVRQPCHIGHWSDVTKLVRVGHSADSLDHAVGDVELDHADHAPCGVVQHGARLAVDPGQP